MDESTPALSGLQVDGTLTFARKNLNLTSDWLVVHGTFRIGTVKKPFAQDAVITLTGNGAGSHGRQPRAARFEGAFVDPAR
jgi:hypothetical protein